MHAYRKNATFHFIGCSSSVSLSAHVEVYPLQDMLRSAWKTNKYMSATSATTKSEKRQPFLVEETSRPTVASINELMSSDYAWSCIQLIATIARESDRLGVWAECCPCPEHAVTVFPEKQPRTKRQRPYPPGAATCSFRCCRAPELAAGRALNLQSNHLDKRVREFNQNIADTPPQKRAELAGSFSKAIGRLWGLLVVVSM